MSSPLAQMVKDVAGVNIGQVDCQAHKELCVGNQVHSYPTVRLYPPGRTDTTVWQYVYTPTISYIYI